VFIDLSRKKAMQFSNRPHPLQSSRFWFMILACVAATAMWQMGMFPGDADHDEFEEFAEIDLLEADPEDEAGPPRAAADESLPRTAMAETPSGEPSTAPVGQREVSETQASSDGWWLTDRPTEPDMLPAETAATAQPAEGASEPPPLAATQSPFGPANPEFVGAPDSQPATATNATGTPEWTAETSPRSEADVQTASAQIVQPANDATDTVPSEVQNGAYDFTVIDNLLAQGDDVGAHRELSTQYWQRPELRPLLIDRIQQTARRIYFEPTPHYMEPYVVQPGDTLQSIAHRYEVAWQFLAKLNQVEPTQIRPGQELKVIRGPFSAVVDLSDYEITVHAHGYFVCRFPVGTGANNSTPIGKFTVEDKLVDPTYYGEDGVVAHDDPANPLGEHWISIGNSYGIHGTIDPDSIGRAESQGCVRLRNEDVAEVYDFLTVGSEVVIRE
jgi:lipoprotein-anchoring transpeptidase ErfK/SrfK